MMPTNTNRPTSFVRAHASGRSVGAFVSAIVIGGTIAAAQCVGGGEWIPFPPASAPGPGAVGLDVVVWDPDGAGPLSDRLIVGTNSIPLNPEGELLAFIAQWDGEDLSPWRPVGGGVCNGWVRSLTIAGDNTLVAGGHFTHAGGTGGQVGDDAVEARCLARWDGTQWHAMGDASFEGPVNPNGDDVNALATLPNGDVVAGGWWFDTVGGVSVRGVARWDGTAWHAMGQGLSNDLSIYGFQPNIWKLLTRSNGTLAAAGGFTRTGLSPLFELAVWDGLDWTGATHQPPLFTGAALCVAELPGGTLVVGGTANGFGGSAAQTWSGGLWHDIGNMTGGTIYSLFTLPNGDLLAGGEQLTVEGEDFSPLARWDGVAWSRMMPPGSAGRIYDMTMFRGDLVATGNFTTAADDGTPQYASIARWRAGPCTPQPCPGDHNNDGAVDLIDLLDFVSAWSGLLGQSVAMGTPGDVDGNGAVDLIDLLDYLSEWSANLGLNCP